MPTDQIIHQHNNTVLYSCTKTSYLYNYITIRMTMYRDKRAVLLVRNWFYNKDPIYKRLLENGIFDEVAPIEIYPGATFLNENPAASVAELKRSITDHFDAELYKIGSAISDFFSIVLQTDRSDYEFDCYLNLRKVPHLYFELAKGQFSKRGKYMENEFKPAFKYLIAELQAFSGKSPYATTFYHHDTESFSPTLGKLRLRHNLKVEVNRINQDDRKRILAAYNYVWHPPAGGNTCMISLQSRALFSEYLENEQDFLRSILRVQNNPEIKYQFLIQNVIDFFTNQDDIVFLKTHPNNPISLESIKNNFNSEVNILPNMPGQFYELEPSIREHIFDALIDFGSLDMSLSYKQGYLLGRNFTACIPVINRLWFVLGLLQKVFGIEVPIGAFGVSSKHIKLLAKKRFDRDIACVDIRKLDLDAHKVVIVKDFEPLAEPKQSSDNDILIVLRSEKAPVVTGYSLTKFVITKEPLKENILCTLHDEEFYVLTKNDEIKVKIDGFTENKDLRMTGVRLVCAAQER